MTTEIKRFYVGFNTSDYENFGGEFNNYNVQCIEKDLMNAIFTVKGDRLMMPEYGTRIPLMVFEPNDQNSIDTIMDDLETVFSQEPRIKVLNLDVIPAKEGHALIFVAKVNYLEFNVTKDLFITVNSQ